MKGGSVNKKRNFIRPSPNEEGPLGGLGAPPKPESTRGGGAAKNLSHIGGSYQETYTCMSEAGQAAIVQSEQDRRKKIRLKQVREQEKAFAIKVRQNIKAKRENELKVLSEQLKEQWTEKQQAELSNLEKKYQKNLEKLGDGHTAAMKDQDALKKDQRTLTKKERQRAIQRHNQAIYELSLERTRSQQAENDRAAARAKAVEAEKARAAMIASLPPMRDMIQDFELREQKLQPKSVEDFKSTRYHLQQPVIQVERMSKENQIDARVAAAEEEDKIHGIREEIQRSEAEQAEKARLRHKHALAQLKIEEDRKKLMDDLSELERLDRQRRQEAVARIPVRIFQPPHKRIEDAEDRQRDLEQAFEDMYMIQTGYTGDLTIALEPSMDPTTISGEHQPQGLEDASEKSPAAVIPVVSIPHDQESTDDSPRGLGEGSEETAQRREDKRGKTPKEDRTTESVPAKGEDAVKRLLLRIQRQREQGKKMKDQTSSDEQTPRRQPPVSRTAARVPGSRVNILTPLPEEEEEPPREKDTSPTLPPESTTTTTTQQDIPGVVPRDGSLEARTLLHPYEAAQQVRMVRPQRTEEGPSSGESDGTMPESSISQEPELLEQQRLQLQLQEQRKIQERLEEQLEHYNRQFQKISSKIPKGPYAPEEEPSAGGTRRMVAGGAEPTDEEADSFDQINIPVRRFRKEEELPLVGGHVTSSEQSEEGSTSSRRSGTVSLEEQTLDEEYTSESSKSTSDYGISGPSGASPSRDSLEDSKKRSLEEPIPMMLGDHPSDVSSSDDSHGVPSSDYNFQRGTGISHVRDQAAGFMPLEWQKDSRVGSWKPTSQEYLLKRSNHETTQDTVPAESSTDSGHLESEEVTSSSDSTSDVPHSRLLELLERRHVQPFSQSDSGFVPTLPLSSLGAATNVLKSGTPPKKLTDSVRSKNLGQVDGMFPPSSSYPGDFKGTAYSSSLRQRQDTISVSATPSSAIGQTTPSLSRLLDGSPNYLDEYRRKWEEEKKLIENQRQLIRQKQEHQLRRMRYYQDILERYENNSPSGLDDRAPVTSPETESINSGAVVTNVPSKTELASTTLQSLISDSFKSRSDSSQRKSTSDVSYQFQSTNKENESVYANAAPRVPPLVGLKGSSSSSDNSLFTRVSYPWSSSSSGRGSKRFLATSKYSEAAPETRKSTSTSDFSFPSSGTEYHSFPVSPEVSADLGPPNGSRSSIATLSELTDRMTKLTSSSENESGPRGLVFEKVPDKGNWADYLSENRAPEYESSSKYAHPWYQPPTSSSLFTGTEDQTATGDTITGRQWYVPAKPNTASIGSLGPVGEDDSARNVDDLDRAARIDEGIQPPPSSSIRPMGSVGPIFEDISPTTNNLEDQSPGTQQWYLPPKSSIQSMVSFGVSSDISSSNISNLQYPDRVSDSRPQAQQWFVPPKSSLQSIGTPGVFSDGSSPNTSDVKNPENLLKSIQRLGEQWYLPALSRDSEKGESSPERSLYSESVLRDIKRQTTPTSSSARMPDHSTAVVGSSGVTKETSQSSATADSMAVSESVRSEGTATRIGRVGDVFFPPSFKQKEYSDERAVLSPASLSSGSLTSDVSNKLSNQSATSTPEKIDKGNKSDQDHATESTDKEPGNPSKDGTGIEISNASTHTEATEEDDPSYSDIYLDNVGSSATALQDAFARRKQDFVKKSLARVERAKAKRFEVTPRVMVKKRLKPDKPVKPDKPAKPVVVKIIKKSEGVETKEQSSKRKRKK